VKAEQRERYLARDAPERMLRQTTRERNMEKKKDNQDEGIEE
jgi:hypothetical protein